jgi:RNA polymerase sigma factor (sigma-70 family)
MLNKAEQIAVIQGCRRGDRHAQNRLYRAYHGWAWSICARYTQVPELATECVQDAFFKVFTKIDTYGGDLPFEGWFKKILVHTCIDRYRSNQKEEVTMELEDAENESHIAEVLINADAEYLLHLINTLPAVYRTTFNLYAIDGYDYQEIATILDVNIGSVKSNLFKARAKLKQLLKQHQEGKTYGR